MRKWLFVCLTVLFESIEAFQVIKKTQLLLVSRTKQKLFAQNDEEVLSPLVLSLTPSKTIEIHALTMQLREAGEQVISLSVGEPDFMPDATVIEALRDAAIKGETRYTAVTGTDALRTKIAEYLTEQKGTVYKASDIVVSNGAKQAVYESILALCGPGDEVLIPAPYWVSYPEIVKMSGATPIFIETTLESGYKLQPADVKAALTPKTKMLILCNPCNPTGACLDADELRCIAKELEGTRCWVLADEIYEQLYYASFQKNQQDVVDTSSTKKETHTSFAAISPDAYARTVTINGFSKAYAMTGFRLGYLAAPAPVAAACGKIQGQITSCASSLAQAAAIAALNLPQDALDPQVAEFRRRRDYVLTRLEKIASLTGTLECPPAPKGAFYLLPDISAAFGATVGNRHISDSTTFCAALLEARKLALVPGDAFGAPSAIRISYAADQTTLEKAMDALESFLTSDLVFSS